MQLFTYMDHVNGRCSTVEIDTPWEPRWSNSDCSIGLCSPEEVGQRKQSSGEQPISDQQQDELLRDIPQAFVYDFELADYHRDRAAYRAKGGNVLALIKIGEERKARQALEGATLASLTATRLKAMSTHDIFTTFAGAIMAEAEDVRERILGKMGIDLPALIDEIAEGEA